MDGPLIDTTKRRTKSILKVLADPDDTTKSGVVLDDAQDTVQPVVIQQRRSGSFIDNTKDAVGGMRKSFIDTVENLAKDTLLDDNAKQQLLRQDPEALTWLQSAQGLIAQIGLVLLYVGIDIGKGLSTQMILYSSPGSKTAKVEGASTLLMNSLLSFVIGIVFTILIDGADTLKAAMTDVKQIFTYFPVVLMFAMAQNFNTVAYGLKDASTIRVLGQFRLPAMAFFSVFALGHRYNSNHYLALAIIVCGVLSFDEAKGDYAQATKVAVKDFRKVNSTHASAECLLPPLDNRAQHCLPIDEQMASMGGVALGNLCIFLWIMLSVMGSVMSEKILKATAKMPFYLQKVQWEMTGFWCNLLMAFVVPLVAYEAAWNTSMKSQSKKWWTSTEFPVKGNCPGAEERGGDWFSSVGGKGLFVNWWAFAPFMQLFFAILQGWMGGIIVKRLSSVVKSLAKSISLVLTFSFQQALLSPCYQPDAPHLLLFLATVVMCSSILFSRIERPREEKPQSEQTETELQARDVRVVAPAGSTQA